MSACILDPAARSVNVAVPANSLYSPLYEREALNLLKIRNGGSPGWVLAKCKQDETAISLLLSGFIVRGAGPNRQGEREAPRVAVRSGLLAGRGIVLGRRGCGSWRECSPCSPSCECVG